MIQQNYVQVNRYTRPARKNNGVKGVVWHYTATPKATVDNFRKSWDVGGWAVETSKRYAGAHIFVDDNKAMQFVPYDEVAYHAHDRGRCYPESLAPNANFTSIGVEMCTDANNKVTPKTIANAVEVGVELCKKFNLDPMKDFYRHYDVTGKNCPAQWVSNPAEFEGFKKAVKAKLNPPQPKVQVQGDYHIIKAGDTLWGLSREYNVSVEKLKAYNPEVTVRALQIGDKIKLNNFQYHVIEKGDTLWGLSRQFNTTVADIEKLNPDIEVRALKIGDKIRVK